MEQAKLFFILTTILGLIIVSYFLPRIVEYVNVMEPHFAIQGFQDMASVSAQEPDIPDVNREPSPLVRKAMCGDQPCPEGTFCDDLSQTCTPLYPSSDVPEEGYYA